MSTIAKRKNSAAKNKRTKGAEGRLLTRSGAHAPIDRPFDLDVLRRAREIADLYQVVIRRDDGEYVGHGLELPNCIGTGDSPNACLKDTREIMTTAIAVMLEDDDAPPPAAIEGARTEQVNIRFTAEEKLALETAARQQGFRGVSDYVRSAALARGRSKR